MTEHYAVAIVGGGQAGLSMSYCLKERGIDHIIFEQNQIGYAWRDRRWDSFCLVTPNWQCQLPGFPYAGNDPHGFMQKDEIVEYIKDYARFVDPPIREGVSVTSARQNKSTDRFEITTSIGDFTADQVIVAVGGYHIPKRPKMAERLPAQIVQIHASEYKNPQSLPDRPILVVGTGQSGCQIAEDLHLAGKKVHLCVGSAPRSPRRYRGKDVVDWLDRMGYYDLTIDDHPQQEKVRAKANHYLTGRDGGREIDLRQFAVAGMQLHGRLIDICDRKLKFSPDLKQNLDGADAVSESIKKTIDNFIQKHQIEAPLEDTYQAVWEPEAEILDLDYVEANIGAVIWCTGYHANFSWVEIPVFDGKGYPGHERGVTTVSGLYFLGLPWLYTWGSGRFSGIARDAQYIADYIAARKKKAVSSGGWSVVNEFLLGS
ncbi:MSMEG_0569 family flavin-dependent oxidoreductase [Pseudanabaena sp. PCC 6802]|uniref:MSMEG_0569 family flavin-dependent oxidoreductase n=1 Tax=Pseudanabaena sp. PCC 6802 TaxID=118173 RepID=UPI00034975BA|nr:MSMEG_0569 family flavin-dependent oxidoreductase [Pseudanabaena sp. PCC 6802]